MNQNQELITKAKEILKRTQASGGEAFIIGESIYKLINGKKINNMYIYMTLSETKFIEEFSAFKIKKIGKKKFTLGYFGYNYIIICDNLVIDKYRLAKTKSKSKYSRNIMNAICQSDYTIYAMAMNYNGIIYDMFSSRDDIYKRRLNSIFYNPGEVFKDTPSKMLDVIKLVSQTGYKLEKRVVKALKSKRRFIKKLDIDVIASYLKLIIDGDNAKDALKYLYKTKIYKCIPLFKFAIKRGALSYRKEDPYIFFGMGMVYDKKYEPFVGKVLKNEMDFQQFVEMAIKNPKCDFSINTLYNFGLDKCLMANKINSLLGRSKNKHRTIKRDYNNLIIKSVKELKIKREEIKIMFPMLNDSDITILIDELVNLVLEKKIKNNLETLKDVVTKKVQSIIRDVNAEPMNITDPLKDTNIVKDTSIVKDADVVRPIGASKENISLGNNKTPEQSILEEMQKRQIELQNKLDRMENEALRRELNDEIERKINATGILNDFETFRRENVKKIIYSLYYESLIETEKYKKLKE